MGDNPNWSGYTPESAGGSCSLASPSDNPSLYDPTVTYSYGKYSCLRSAFYGHMFCNYIIFLSGIACMITRVLPARWKWLHAMFGRLYILAMLWTTACSLLINNTGLPAGVLISFIWVLGGLTIGWAAILYHNYRMTKDATAIVTENILVYGMSKKKDVGQLISEAKGELIAQRTFVQRLFSMKALHGVLMTVSWMNIAGRLVSTSKVNHFSCMTYPVYKPIDDLVFNGAGQGNNLTLVPETTPFETRSPWGAMGLAAWGVVTSIGMGSGAFLLGALYTLAVVKPWRPRKSANAGLTDATPLVSSLSH